MGTTMTVLSGAPTLGQATRLVEDLFATWEDSLSRFTPESELSYVNGQAGRPVQVSRLFWFVMGRALEAARATDGVYDPSMGTHIVEAGYDRTFDEVPTRQHHVPGARSAGGSWRKIHLDPVARTVTLPVGMRLDFGGIAKGLAVDAAVERLENEGLAPILVEAGGDLRVLGTPPGLDGWQIRVDVPDRPQVVTLHGGAMATSSRLRRQWQAGGRAMHHILDPRTGVPAASPLVSVTVAATLCAQADVAAKVALILGRAAGSDFLQTHGMSALLADEHGAVHTVGTWPIQGSA